MRPIGRALRLARRLGSVIRGERLIFIYHRIAEVERDPWDLCVRPARFSEQVQSLMRYGPCLTLSDMMRRQEDGTLPRRAVAITFDDGYADNLHEAASRLERAGVPATFFVSPGLIASGREFWWDELERLVFEPDELPGRIPLHAGPAGFDACPGAASGCRAGQQSGDIPPRPREGVYRDLWRLMRPLPDEIQQELLDQLASAVGLARSVRATHRPMTPAEAVQLARSPLAEMGAHTMTHPVLPELPAERQRIEIEESKAACEAFAERRVSCFSYPYGIAVPQTAALVREAGFSWACSTRGGAVRRDTDPYSLPRVHALDWTGEQLSAALARAALH